jgi:hypothetical protein
MPKTVYLYPPRFKSPLHSDAGFHTLRQTAASWFVRQGSTCRGGTDPWTQTPQVTQRQAPLSADYMASAVEKLEGIVSGMLPATS